MSQNSFLTSSEIPEGIVQGALDQLNVRVALVTARWNSSISYKLEEGAYDFLTQKKIKVERVRVPGAVEAPLAAKWLLDQGFDGVVVLACVIRGETTHYDQVCNSVERGCTELQLSTGKPVTFGVLTVENEAQALARVDKSAHGHKGEEAAQTCLEMLGLKSKLIQNKT